MSGFIINNLITRGSNHELRCEDDIFHYENDDYIVAVVFDGCSSGNNSHFASTFCKYIINTFLQENQLYTNPNNTLESVSKDIIYYVWESFNYIPFSHQKDVDFLTTIVLCIIDKNNECYTITMCGDGVISVNDEVYTIHDKKGDSVWYLSTVNENDFEYYYSNCFKLNGCGIIDISISTDGIDTFKDKFGVCVNDESRNVFFKSNNFINTNNMLKRLYNTYIKGFNRSDNIPCMNEDDFTMIRIINKN